MITRWKEESGMWSQKNPTQFIAIVTTSLRISLKKRTMWSCIFMSINERPILTNHNPTPNMREELQDPKFRSLLFVTLLVTNQLTLCKNPQLLCVTISHTYSKSSHDWLFVFCQYSWTADSLAGGEMTITL